LLAETNTQELKLHRPPTRCLVWFGFDNAGLESMLKYKEKIFVKGG